MPFSLYTEKMNGLCVSRTGPKHTKKSIWIYLSAVGHSLACLLVQVQEKAELSPDSLVSTSYCGQSALTRMVINWLIVSITAQKSRKRSAFVGQSNFPKTVQIKHPIIMTKILRVLAPPPILKPAPHCASLILILNYILL